MDSSQDSFTKLVTKFSHFNFSDHVRFLISAIHRLVPYRDDLWELKSARVIDAAPYWLRAVAARPATAQTAMLDLAQVSEQANSKQASCCLANMKSSMFWQTQQGFIDTRYKRKKKSTRDA